LNEEEFMKVEKEKIPLIGLAGKRNDTLYKRIKYIAESYEG
jgi:protein disulfide-isomerase A1